MAKKQSNTEKAERGCAPFSPSAFVQKVIDAVLPLVDGEKAKEGVSKVDIIEALKPLFGHFTVRDAVLVHFMFEPEANIDAEGLDSDSPKRHAIFEAREALISFACNAKASSPECAVTRMYLADQEGDLHEVDDGSVWKAMTHDVPHLRSGRYDGHRFADTDLRGRGWLPHSLVHEAMEAEHQEGGAQ
jgi:hypothetical protein